jgi:hypothetical protein
MNKEKTKVLFLVETDSDGNSSTLAVFPDKKNGRGSVECYTHAEQHSNAGYDYYEGLKRQKHPDYMPLYQELVSLGYDLEVLNIDEGEPIKRAITSAREGRTILVYFDGGVKLFDQGPNHETKADVLNFEPHEIEGGKLEQIIHFSHDEIEQIQQALQAP